MEDIEDNGRIERSKVTLGKRAITMYKPTQKGVEFCRDILDPYEKMFPRRKEEEEEEEENKKGERLTGNKEEKNLNSGSLMLLLI